MMSPIERAARKAWRNGFDDGQAAARSPKSAIGWDDDRGLDAFLRSLHDDIERLPSGLRPPTATELHKGMATISAILHTLADTEHDGHPPGD